MIIHHPLQRRNSIHKWFASKPQTMKRFSFQGSILEILGKKIFRGTGKILTKKTLFYPSLGFVAIFLVLLKQLTIKHSISRTKEKRFYSLLLLRKFYPVVDASKRMGLCLSTHEPKGVLKTGGMGTTT